MGFHKRHLSRSSILSKVPNGFSSFEIYLTNADAYISSDDWSTDIYRRFNYADKKDRLKIYEELKQKHNEQTNSIL